ncbi:hypothetical protein ACHQM5_015364 [Ranunculus cassubicifolius]
MKVNTDGAASGGKAGIGLPFRNSEGDFSLIVAEGLRLGDNFWTECVAVVTGEEIAAERGWLNIWIETDSESIVKGFSNGKIPWRIRGRWWRIKQRCNVTLTHIWRGKSYCGCCFKERSSSM